MRKTTLAVTSALTLLSLPLLRLMQPMLAVTVWEILEWYRQII